MKINRIKKEKIENIIGDFSGGEVFEYERELYMRIRYVNKFPYNAVRLDDGMIFSIPSDAKVFDVNAELVTREE